MLSIDWKTTLTALSIRQAMSSALKIERWTPFLSSAFDNRRVDCLKAVWKGRRGPDNALADVSADTLRRYPSRLRICTGIHASRNICIIVAIAVGAILVVEPILTLSAASRRANGSSPISDWRSVCLARSLRYFYERILSALNWAASSARSYSEKDLRSVGSAHSNARRRGRLDGTFHIEPDLRIVGSETLWSNNNISSRLIRALLLPKA